MTAKNYDICLKGVLAHEGGYVNHPSDPGGETNFGITIAVARANGYHGAMRSIPMGVVKKIYRTKYWDALRCDELPSGVDYAVFDYGVNSGVGRAAKVLQQIAGVVPDGTIGNATIAAVNRRSAVELVERICDERIAFLMRLKTWPTFGKGWAKRVSAVRRDAGTLAVQVKPPPDIEPVPPDQPQPSILKRFWMWITGGGIGAAGIGFTDWRALVVLAVFLLVVAGLIVWFMGPDRVRAWVRKQVNR